jgi:riboflavin kinase/FMN adenylyltransferase
MRKWIGIICVLLGVLCILSALGFIVYNRWEDKNAEEVARDLLQDVQSIIQEQTLKGNRVSSSLIRRLVQSGEMESATRYLGHPHMLTGQVLHGKKLGRTLGVPTANLQIPAGIAVPKFGVYACRAIVDGASFPAVANVGTRPTVSGNGITVEPWILDFEGDLYGKEIRLEFYRFLRSEMKFADLAALKEQIHNDAEETRRYFENL